MAKVIGVGGVFFKSLDPEKLRSWYASELGFDTSEYGTNFEWLRADKPEAKGMTVWAPFKASTDYFKPSSKEFMLNFIVDDLEGMLKQLAAHGIQRVGEIQDFDYGKFAHILDPEGNKIELWEPKDDGDK